MGNNVSETPKKSSKIVFFCAIATGALTVGGVGGYFLGKYLNKGEDKKNDTSITVVLNAGNGYFGTDVSSNYIIIEDVKSGETLSSLKGYKEPISLVNDDFEGWMLSGSDMLFSKNSKITATTYLTATFSKGLAHIREEAINEINKAFNNILYSLESSEESTKIINAITELKEKILADDSLLNVSNDKGLVKPLGELTVKIFYSIAFASSDNIQTIVNAFNNRLQEIKDINDNLSPTHASVVAALSLAFFDGLSKTISDEGRHNLDLIYSRFKNLIKDPGTDETMLKIIYLMSSGVLQSAAVTNSDMYETLENYIFNSEDGDIALIERSAKENPNDELLIATLSNLANSFYKVLSQFDSFSWIYMHPFINFYRNTARKSYKSNPTTIEGAGFNLNKEVIQSCINITNANYCSDYMMRCDRCIATFFDEINSKKIDDSTIIVAFEHLVEKQIMAYSVLTYERVIDLEGIVSNLFGAICGVSPSYQKYVIEFANIVMETASKMPREGSPEYVQGGATIEALRNAQNDFLNELLFEINSVEQGKHPEISLDYFIKIFGIQIESIIFSDFENRARKEPKCFSLYNSLITNIEKGIINKDVENDILYFSGYVNGCAQFFGKVSGYYDKSSIMDMRFGTLLNSLSEMQDEPEWTDDAKTYFASMFGKYLSLSFNDYRSVYLNEGNGEELYNTLIDEVMEFPLRAKGKSSKYWRNLVRFYSLFFSSEDFFIVYDTETGVEDTELEYQRISWILDSKDKLELGFDHDRYDEIYDVWKNEFFSKVTSTTTEENLQKLFNQAVTDINKILNSVSNNEPC